MTFARSAQKELRGLPAHIIKKLMKWVDDVEQVGLEEVRKRPGWHDEPLQGKRADQRSVRLSIFYRAIYVVKDNVEVLVVEVNKHDY